jgi:hypothetical protein
MVSRKAAKSQRNASDVIARRAEPDAAIYLTAVDAPRLCFATASMGSAYALYQISGN